MDASEDSGCTAVCSLGCGCLPPMTRFKMASVNSAGSTSRSVQSSTSPDAAEL
ncbi:hypothetical protein IscW_ISCW013148 [Ixodes scapularis]|uniref:Uncharacterized protein n=1 Tax=Ixodes scapularis TaxID=6945 RepID=B7QCE5_IXOSC|nr:hypothetical protein IscW_ISCW013148 [Ixodes scapularis]|eukprot:XP_002413209.1 hypothetical protein IscW_ISCW013148 [Ixodes scapularis]